MHNILIIAANGMAGHVISDVLATNKEFKILNTIRILDNVQQVPLSDKSDSSSNTKFINLELHDLQKLDLIINDFKPEYIINCSGILVRDSKQDPSEAIFINSYLPNYLNKLSKKNTFKLIQISTDCVFSGTKGNYTENDTTDALDTYGRTKALGEVIDNNNLTIRTSIIGPELKANGTGLMHWFFNQSGTTKGFTNAFWSGVTTLELAKFINSVLDFETNNNTKKISGLYHLTNNHVINKYELLTLIKNIFEINHINITPDSQHSVNKSFVNTDSETKKLLDYATPDYKDMINQLREYMAINERKYQQYKLFS